MKTLCLVLILFLALMLTFNKAESASPVKIGFDDVRSGPFKSNGDQFLVGMEVAIKKINGSGGLLGRPIELVIEDNQLKPEIAIQKLKKLILEDKCEAIIHGSSSSVALAIAQTMPRYKKPYICIGAATMGVTSENFNPYVFRTNGNVVQYVKALAIYFGKQKELKKVFLINWDNSLGHDTAELYEKFIKEVAPNTEIVGNEFAPVFTKEYAPYISKINASGADYAFTSVWGTDLVQLMTQGRSLGMKIPAGGLFMSDWNAVRVMGDASIGCIGADTFIMGLNTPKAKEFEEYIYKESGGFWPVSQIWMGYIGMMMYVEGVKKAGTFEAERFIKKFEGLEWDGPSGIVMMRPQDHQIQLPVFIGKVLGKTKYFDHPWFTPVQTVTREQLSYKPEEFGWKPYKEK